jgi:hypothetical protein
MIMQLFLTIVLFGIAIAGFIALRSMSQKE